MNHLETLTTVTVTGTDLDRVVDQALERFDCSRAEVDVEILSPGRRGFLGLGARPATVKVRLNDRAYVARFVCERLLHDSGLAAQVSVSQSSEQIDLLIEADSSAMIIGKHGQVLDALQYLVTTLTDRFMQADLPILLDAGGYRLKRHRYLKGLASKLSTKVRSSGEKVTVEPLPHHERKLLHAFFRDQRGVTSSSVGQGYEKRIVVTPEG